MYNWVESPSNGSHEAQKKIPDYMSPLKEGQCKKSFGITFFIGTKFVFK